MAETNALVRLRIRDIGLHKIPTCPTNISIATLLAQLMRNEWRCGRIAISILWRLTGKRQ